MREDVGVPERAALIGNVGADDSVMLAADAALWGEVLEGEAVLDSEAVGEEPAPLLTDDVGVLEMDAPPPAADCVADGVRVAVIE